VDEGESHDVVRGKEGRDQHQQNIKTVIERESCEGCAVCNVTASHKVWVDHSAIHIIEIHHILSQCHTGRSQRQLSMIENCH
jgi:hypothetical protein